MPKFIDYHAKLPPMPPEMAQQMQATIQAGKPDQFGVRALNAFFGADGQSYCLTEAPSAEAVCQSHQAMGMPQDKGNVVQVTSIV